MLCSNPFLDGWPTKSNPSPSLFLTVSSNTAPAPKPRKSPRKQKALPHKTENAKKKLDSFDGNFSTGQNELISEDNIENNSNTIQPGFGEKNVDECNDEKSFSRDIRSITEPMSFAHITREADVSTFTGIEGPEVFKAILEMLKPKAQVMTYWDGQKKTLRLCKRASSAQLTQTLLSSPNYNLDPLLLPMPNDWPARKLSLKQEVLLTLMKIRLNLLNDDLTFRF